MLEKISCSIADVGGRAQRLMKYEMRQVYGAIPPEIDELGIDDGNYCLTGDMYILRTGDGLNFYYRKGQGIIIERAGTLNSPDEALWLNGSVYSAVASINGFRPLHASAVSYKNRVYAFSGPSGAGKSTLIAALGGQGFPMFCDDTLVLDISDHNAILCLPGHKRLKLTEEAVQLSGSAREEKVGAGIDKFYAKPIAGVYGKPLPLAELIYLEVGEEIKIARLGGGERFLSLKDGHYTTDLFNQAQNTSRKELFALHAGLAGRINMARFTRPKHADSFLQGVEFIANYIKRIGGLENDRAGS